MMKIDEKKAKILVTVIPFVLIILILAVTLIVSGVRNRGLEKDNKELQESIKEYADGNMTQREEPVGESKSESGSETKNEAKDVVNMAVPQSTEKPSVVSGQDAGASPTPYREIMENGQVNYDKVSFDKDEQLKEMMTYWADNNQKALDDLANLERFIAMSWRLRGTKDFYYYGDTDSSGQPSGTGIAVYADNQYYYGQWENGVRSGNGTWIHYHMHVSGENKDLYTYHQYTGSFKNDLPDGEGSEHYDYNTELFVENTGYNTNLVGSYKAGLIHGEFYITNLYSDENIKEWYARAENGSWIYQNENRDSQGRGPVMVEDRDPENYIWMSPSENRNIGVPCLISSR